MLTTGGDLGVQPAQSWVWRWWSVFFPVKFFNKNYSFEAFLVPTKGNPQNDWFKSISKKCNKPRSGKKGSSLGAQIIVDLFQVYECQNRDNTTPTPWRWLTWNRRTRCWGNEKQWKTRNTHLNITGSMLTNKGPTFNLRICPPEFDNF